jgi:glycosyltransferase involved in cell wall biosynthesis
MPISGDNIVILVPTKDRPGKIKNFLDSLAGQSQPCGRVIIVASGADIEELVLSFSDRLPVEYIYCHTPGQIRQRNMGIALLDETTPITGFFDDDIVLESDTLEKIIAFWNHVEPETAGIACNITNTPSWSPSWLYSAVYLANLNPGQITNSGYNVPITNIKQDIRSAWLPGGATFWRTDIVKQFAHKEIPAKRAMCEDLLFSYPIGKKYPLYVSHESHVRNESINDHVKSGAERYYGRTELIWRLYFISLHKEFHAGKMAWSYIMLILADIIRGFMQLRLSRFEKALGRVEGLLIGINVMIFKKDLIELLHKND